MGIIFADDATQRQCRHQGGVSMRAISWNLLSQTGSPGRILILISSVLSHIIYLTGYGCHNLVISFHSHMMISYIFIVITFACHMAHIHIIAA